jgi:hypothetical protein
MKNKNCCEHPNCRCAGIKTHPKTKNKILCEQHYLEVLKALENKIEVIVLTCPNE